MNNPRLMGRILDRYIKIYDELLTNILQANGAQMLHYELDNLSILISVHN